MESESGVIVDGVFYENPIIAYERVKNDSIEVDVEGSETVDYYRGKSLLITGGTGFMGKVTVEKLLRVCPDVDSIYILIREKKGKNMYERLEKVFNDPLFGYLNEKNPKYRHKITPISGDVALPGLGINDEDRKLLTSKVQIIIHAAANVSLDCKLKTSLDINFFGTQKTVEFAKACQNLESFVYISTAFANCGVEVIEEKFYKPHISPDELMAMIEGRTDDEIEKLTPKLLSNIYPYTYLFTKTVIERYLEERSDQIPLMIFRPSLIMPTHKEPIRGWIDNFYGPVGVTAAAGLGLLHTVRIEKDNVADMVPVDYCVNAMLVAASKVHSKKSNEVPIYNYTSSTENPINWSRYMTLMNHFGEQIPSRQGVWIYFLYLEPNLLIHYLQELVFQFIPGAFVDLALILTLRKPKMIKAYKKIHRFLFVISQSLNLKWKWRNDKTQELWRNMTEADRRVFPFSIRLLDWEEYCKHTILGMRMYLVKEDLSTLEEGKRKYRMFRICHNTIKYLLIFLGLRILYGILSTVLF